MQTTRQAAAWGGTERKRVDAVVETLANLHSCGESLAEIAHDARNMVTALGLYCELLEEPGVLAAPFTHYGYELRLVAAASRRLVEKLAALDSGRDGGRDTVHDPEGAAARTAQLTSGRRPVRSEAAGRTGPYRRWDLLPAVQIDNMAAELLANRNLLAALAGPAIALTVDAGAGALPVRLTGEDLTRVLVNLVKNAAEAMPAGGRIHLGLLEPPVTAGQPDCLLLAVEDCGPGIPQEALDTIFEAGFSTQPVSPENEGRRAAHRGLGLSISKSIIESAGGRIRAINRNPAGARLEIELPVRRR
jgi:signal transduction histidine kinase